MRDLGISVAGSFIAGIMWAIAAEFTKPTVMEHVFNIAKSLAPLWVGVVVFIIIRAALFLRRLSHGHDAVFAAWFRQHERLIGDVIERKFTYVESELSAHRQMNANAMNSFHETFERRLSAVEEALRRDQ